MHGKPLIALFGPTGVGKTQIAEGLARKLADLGESPVAISADALAVYREIPIITGSPASTASTGLDYRLVGIRSVTETFSVGEFAELAHREIDDAFETGRSPIVVGGTGLYLRAALCELSVPPSVDPAIRRTLEDELALRGESALRAELALGDPAAEQRISAGDSRRIIRALELLRAGQRAPADPSGIWLTRTRWPTIAFSLVRDRDELRRRIEERVDSMLTAGAIDEVERAHALGAGETARAAIGFRELLSRDIEAMKLRTWHLSRRQMSWVRRLESTTILDLSTLDDDQAASRILEDWHRTP